MSVALPHVLRIARNLLVEIDIPAVSRALLWLCMRSFEWSPLFGGNHMPRHVPEHLLTFAGIDSLELDPNRWSFGKRDCAAFSTCVLFFFRQRLRRIET